VIALLTRICFINPTRSPKTQVYGLARHLPKSRFEGVILQPKKVRSSEESSLSGEVENNFEVINFPCFFVPRINYTLPIFRKQLEIFMKLSKEEKFDIIQVADYFYPTSMMPIFVKPRFGIPSILTVNALPGYSWYFGDKVVDSTAMIYTYSVGRLALSSYDRVVALYKKISEDVKMLGVPQGKVSMIPNGVDYGKFEGSLDSNKLRDELSIKDCEKILLFAGRLVKVKRVDVLISVTKMLLKEGLRVKTVIVGDGPMRKYYEELSRPLGNNVLFTGYVPKKHMPMFYHMADIFVLPSLSEGLPNVLLEASAAGKVCVASGVNGVWDIIEHGKTGFITRNLDPSSYYRYVKILLMDENLSMRLGKNARAFVRKNFSWNTVVKKYVDMYERMLETFFDKLSA